MNSEDAVKLAKMLAGQHPDAMYWPNSDDMNKMQKLLDVAQAHGFRITIEAVGDGN